MTTNYFEMMNNNSIFNEAEMNRIKMLLANPVKEDLYDGLEYGFAGCNAYLVLKDAVERVIPRCSYDETDRNIINDTINRRWALIKDQINFLMATEGTTEEAIAVINVMAYSFVKDQRLMRW